MPPSYGAATVRRWRRRGCSSVVERHVANVNVVGSSPITRFLILCQHPHSLPATGQLSHYRAPNRWAGIPPLELPRAIRVQSRSPKCDGKIAVFMRKEDMAMIKSVSVATMVLACVSHVQAEECFISSAPSMERFPDSAGVLQDNRKWRSDK